MDQSVLDLVTGAVAPPQPHPQRRGHQRGGLRGRGMPADDRPGMAIDHERHIGESCPRSDIGEVSNPPAVGRLGGEVPVQQVRGPTGGLVRDGRSHALAAHQPVDTELAHQPVDATFRHGQSLPAQQRGHLPSPIHRLRTGLALLIDSGGEDRVDDESVREVTTAGLSGFPCPIRPRGDPHALLTQDLADRLDRATFAALLIDEADDQRRRGSSSPAKKTAASRRIALASRSSRTSRRSALTSSTPTEVTPSRWP